MREDRGKNRQASKHNDRESIEAGTSSKDLIEVNPSPPSMTASVENAGESISYTLNDNNKFNLSTMDVDYSEQSTMPLNENKASKRTSSSTLLKYRLEPEKQPESNATIDDVMAAISSLNIKVDKISNNTKTQHASLTELAFEGMDKDENRRNTLEATKKAHNILELDEASELLDFFYDESSEVGVLRCVPCFKANACKKPGISSLSTLEAQRVLNNNGNGSLATGLFMKKETTRLMIEGHNKCWHHQKNACLEHLCLIGEGSRVHKKAMEVYTKEKKAKSKTTSTLSNIFRAAIVDIKLGAAGIHLETLLAFLSSCSVDVGNIGHSRKHLPDILYCLEKAVNAKISSWLNTPLPSTLLPPHFWATIDKGTPARTTNQAILIIARDENGNPCPIPVDSPKVYIDTLSGSYHSLAELMIRSIGSNFGPDILSRLTGVSADGPYQTVSFRNKLLEELNLEDMEQHQLVLPVSWDGGHAVNLGVTDIKDSTTRSGEHMNRFIKRCNIFNTILARGKGFAFLELVDESALRPVSYASQRFASSSFNQWVKIEKSFDAYWKAFDLLHPRRIEEEEYQYMIAGFDFISDLLCFLDTLEPVVDLMLRLQSLDSPIWKLKLWWPKVKAKMELLSSGNFPRLQAAGKLQPGSVYKGIELLDGWLLTATEGTGKNKVYTWAMREEEEIEEDHVIFAKDLLKSVDKRVCDVTSARHIEILEVFDAAKLVRLHCGTSSQKLIADGDYDDYGVKECKEVLNTMCKLDHIKQSGLSFDPKLAYRYMLCLKDAVGHGTWNGHCGSWFIDKSNKILLLKDCSISEIYEVDNSSLFESTFFLKLSDGKEGTYRLHEQSVYSSFYCDKNIYSVAKPPSCAILDFALSKGGPEAIAESYYSTMRFQQQQGGQKHENLIQRTKLSWCLPSLKKCESLMQDGVKTYIEGDERIKPHRQNTFFSNRAIDYDVSKVIDRVNAESGRCPFLA